MHISVKLDHYPCEFINVKPLNPLISKCEIKVCYVSDEPNRNRSVITKDVAREMANSLPGSPIVGYYNEEKGDFEEHNRIIDISNGQFKIKDTTRPYGFVDLGAKVWFQKFLDDGEFEREYLMTEGYIWTGQYPEAQRIVEKGNNQSMELDENFIDAHWTKDNKGNPQFFIINEAIISKLCILGEDVEPCFEGASISKLQFSFEDSFKEQLFSMMNEMKNILNEGGATETMIDNENVDTVLPEETVVEPTVEEVVTEEPVVEEPVIEEPTTDPVEEPAEEPATEEPSEEPAVAYAEEPAAEEEKEKCPECGKSKEECTCDEDKPAQYNLDEIPEYVELSQNYSELESKYNALVALNETQTAQINELIEFKKVAQRKEKMELINNQFYMLSDDDKKDVIENIDTYSLDEIEAKLSIICVRNKVNFSLDDDKTPGTDPMTYNLNGSSMEDDVMPAWLKAVMATAKTLN